VRLHLTVRRFFCDHAYCNRRIFSERLASEIRPYMRRTDRLKVQLQRLAFHLGGETGALLLPHLGLSSSPDTLRRLVRQLRLPAYPTPRVLGVDDWARRKGQTYGTLLVDLERHRPVEVLPERDAQTLAAWLKEHPGVEIISRDRSSTYAEGATLGAPHAVQVADRFHLLQNLREALQRLLDRHPSVLRETAHHLAALAEVDLVSSTLERPEDTPCPAAPALVAFDLQQSEESAPQEREAMAEAPSTERPPTSYSQLRFAAVKALQHQGFTQRAIARQLHMSRRTVHRYVALDTLPRRAVSRVTWSKVTPYWTYVRHRWQAGYQNGRQLVTELQQQGFTGSYSSVRRALQKLTRKVPSDSAANHPEPGPSLLSPRQVSWLLIRSPEELESEERTAQTILCEVSAAVTQAHRLAQDFVTMVRERKAELLEDWLARATEDTVAELHHFATRLKSDYEAVKAALSLPWSNGQVEGHIHRLKLIKRQMYGRANFDLLQRRFLCAG
jgi:transposase